MLGELTPCSGGDPIPLLKPKLLIGRRSSCDISLRFPNVSSHHCELSFINGYWYVEDVGSRNGIRVNGTKCEGKYVLPGDTIAIARHEYAIHYKPSGDGPPPGDVEDLSKGLLEKAGLTGQRAARQRREARQSAPDNDGVKELPPDIDDIEIDDDLLIDDDDLIDY